MAQIVFPYKIYKGFACPIINIEILSGKGWIGTDAYVDSGASYSIFLVQEAQRLGINYTRGKQILVTVGDGSMIPVYLHRLPIRIRDINFHATIGFSPRLGVGFNLLGRKDIFERFDVTFSDTNRTVTFIPQIK